MLLRGILISIIVIATILSSFCNNKNEIVQGDSIANTQKRELRIATSLSVVIPGAGQIYNKDYWKAPLFISGIGATGYAAYHTQSLMQSYQNAYDSKMAANNATEPQWDLYSNYSFEDLQEKIDKYRSLRNYSLLGMSAFYLTNIVDAYAQHQHKHSPAAATLMSAIMPGAGQLYNKKYWKIPVIYTGFSTLIYFVNFNNEKYLKFKDEYELMVLAQTDPNVEEPYPGASPESIKNERDRWRRYRDLNYIGIGILYILNILDANVDANLLDYDVSYNLSMQFAPSLTPIHSQTNKSTMTNIGLSFSIQF